MASPSERREVIESPSKKQRTNFSWTKEAKMALLKLCVDYKESNGFTQPYKWGSIAKSLNAILGTKMKSGLLISRLAGLKADYSMWKTLRDSDTGLGVDPTTGIIVAEPQWWTRKIQEKPEIGKYRTTGFPMEMEDLCSRLFDAAISRGDGVDATGMGSTRGRNRDTEVDESHAPSANSTQGVVADHPTNFVPTSLAEEDDEIVQPVQTPSGMQNDDGVQQTPRSTEIPRDSPYTGSASGSTKRSSRFANKHDIALGFFESFDKKWDRQIEVLSGLTSAPVEDSPTVKDCVHEMYRLVDANLVQKGTRFFHFALSLFNKGESYRSTFMEIKDDADKIGFLQLEYDLAGHTRDT